MDDERISEHLSVSEFLWTSHSEFALQQRILWDASQEIRENAYRLARDVFEPVREMIGCPLVVTSGLRCPALNEAVHGAGCSCRPNSTPSRHLFGLAIDVVPVDIDPVPAAYAMLHALRRGQLPFIDKALVETVGGSRWLHLQAAPKGKIPRRMVMESEDGRVFVPLS